MCRKINFVPREQQRVYGIETECCVCTVNQCEIFLQSVDMSVSVEHVWKQ